MIQPVSEQEFAAHQNREVPQSEEVSEGIWTLPLTNKPGHMPFTFTYLLQDAHNDVHLIDSGWDLAENLHAVDAALRRLGAHDGPASVTVTHLHPDHMGLAQSLRKRYGTTVFMHRAEPHAQEIYAQWNRSAELVGRDFDAWGVPAERYEQLLGYATGTPRVTVPVDGMLDDGDLLEIPGRRLRVIHTPGHTPGHLCLHDEDAQLLFSGDALLPKMTPGIGAAADPEQNPLTQYLHSLQRLSALDASQCLPGHEYRYRGVAARAQAIARRHLTRTVEVAAILAQDPDVTAWELGSRLSWGRGWEALDRHYLVSALRQTAMHMELVLSAEQLNAYEVWGRP